MILGDARDDEDHDVLFPEVRRRGVEIIRVHPFDLVTHLGPAGISFTVRGETLEPDLVVGWMLEELLLWIDNPGRDIRVYTVNHHPVFAMYRYAPDGAWVTNVASGGSIAMCPLSPGLADIAARASRAAGTLIGGIDVGENLTTGEYVVYEVNSCPTCEPPVLEVIADFLADAVLRADSSTEAWAPTTIDTDLDLSPELFHASTRHLLHRD
ncbi:hypothetical protein [Brachybacterium hainanense]|uniref:ATP-grasp fold RimK-type domain-containing protein n=1 Tax=Brachybacterium hainanense TaxID=1541174 RepID=A0ABV6R7Q2_9MICO